jgi:ribose transport system ATP-binding protein
MPTPSPRPPTELPIEPTDPVAEPVPLLQVAGVSKGFPGVQALTDMHLELRHGEVLAVVGENGAGKSTLMKLLTGVYTADEGHFAMNGRPLVVNGPKEALAAGLSIIHQEFNLMPHLTVAQNIAIGREPVFAGLFVDERRLNREAAELVERLGLPLDVRRLVGDLTVASQQMVEIAKALSHDAKVLIMDEPTAALNDAEVQVLHDLIRRFTREDTGVIYISHRMDELTAIADRVTVIRDGAYVATVDAATTPVQQVIALMVGRAIDTGATPQNVRDDREAVLSVEGLTTKDLLRDVSFELRRGEILGVAGLMGAGRTEVARAIVGADRTTAGVVRLNGRQVTIRNPADAAALGIGYLSEDRKRYGLLLEQDVAQNIALGSLAKRFTRFGFVDGQAVRSKAAGLVSSLRIKTPSVAQAAKNLSGGNQQKVVIAKWLLNDCDVLIFDEPTRGIDVGAKEEIYGLLNRLAADGKSIVMISSELPEILRMSHRVLVMSQGRVTAVLDRDEATQETVMHHATTKAGAR